MYYTVSCFQGACTSPKQVITIEVVIDVDQSDKWLVSANVKASIYYVIIMEEESFNLMIKESDVRW